MYNKTTNTDASKPVHSLTALVPIATHEPEVDLRHLPQLARTLMLEHIDHPAVVEATQKAFNGQISQSELYRTIKIAERELQHEIAPLLTPNILSQMVEWVLSVIESGIERTERAFFFECKLIEQLAHTPNPIAVKAVAQSLDLTTSQYLHRSPIRSRSRI